MGAFGREKRCFVLNVGSSAHLSIGEVGGIAKQLFGRLRWGQTTWVGVAGAPRSGRQQVAEAGAGVSQSAATACDSGTVVRAGGLNQL